MLWLKAKIRLLPLLAVACWAVLLAACASTDGGPRRQSTGPAMWVIERDGESMWLMGTVHRLPPSKLFGSATHSRIRRTPQWWSPTLQGAIRQADDLVIETTEGQVGGWLDDLQTADVAAESSVARTLAVGQLELLEVTARRYGLPSKQLLGIQPLTALLAFVFLAAPDQQPGSPGVDMVLAHWARVNGKTVLGLETGAERLAVSGAALADVGTELHAQLLVRYVEQIAGEETFDQSYLEMLRAWQEGDIDAFELGVADYQASEPELHGAFLVARNRFWLDRIVAMMGNGRNELVAVGIAHLVGPDSLLDFLRERGYSLRRVDDSTSVPNARQAGSLHQTPDKVCGTRSSSPGAFLCCTAAC